MPRNNNIKARDKVNEMKQQFDLIDPWRINNPNKKQFTWFQRNPVKMSRLGFFLVTEDIMALISKCDIITGYRSDHSIINITLTISNDKRGKGFWKFNTSLLSDQEYVHIIKNTIRNTIERYSLPDQNLDSPNCF